MAIICCQTKLALTLALRDITLQPAPAPHVHQVASIAPAKGDASAVQIILTFYHPAAVQTSVLQDLSLKSPAALASHALPTAPNASHKRNACTAQTAPTFTTASVKLPALLGPLHCRELMALEVDAVVAQVSARLARAPISARLALKKLS